MVPVVAGVKQVAGQDSNLIFFSKISYQFLPDKTSAASKNNFFIFSSVN
jgi:hypothetical protein